MVSSILTYLPRLPGKCLGHMERLRQKTLDFSGPGNGYLVLIGEFLHSQNGDNILQFLIFLQYLLHLHGPPGNVPRRCNRHPEFVRWSPADPLPDKCPFPTICRDKTTVPSKWAKVVAGAGSVRSSAGTYTHCTAVMDPLSVEVIRSCNSPRSTRQGRLISHRRRHTPEQRRNFRAGLGETGKYCQ